MNILAGIKRLRDSLRNEKDPNIILSTKAIIVGMSNFYFNNKREEAERLYKEFCINCEYNLEETDKDLQIIDKHIPGLTNRMCGDCGCVLSFKTRQNIKPCSKWI